jgi:C4-dicarboxylate transporter
MVTDAVNVNPHYRPAEARHADAASSGFVAACYALALLIPLVGFWMGFALLFKRREGHGPIVMVIAFFAAIVWTRLYLDAVVSDVSEGMDGFD